MTRNTCLIVLLLCLCSCGGAPPPIELPSILDVSLMIAGVDNPGPGIPDVPKFEVTPSDYGKILVLFADRQRDGRPSARRGLGHIDVKTTDGRTIDIELYSTGAGPGAYRIGDIYYRGSTDAEIIAVLKECNQRSNGGS